MSMPLVFSGRGIFFLPQPTSLPLRMLTADAEHPIGRFVHLLQVAIQRGHVEQDCGLPGGLSQMLDNILHHMLGVLVEQGVMLHDHQN